MRPLQAGEVHLWTVERSAAGWPAADDVAGLSEDERRRADRFLDGEARSRFIVGRKLARQILAEHLGVSPAAVEFVISPRGKPGLRVSGFHFNLSHAGDIVLLGLAWCEIGVDVERIRRDRITASLARRVFGERERELIAASTGPERMRFQFWVRKEACLKAAGTGLVADLASIDVGDPGRVHMPDGGLVLRAVDVALGDGYAAAIAGPTDVDLRPTMHRQP
jgi:4'-phosphopantetheinyl transferase